MDTSRQRSAKPARRNTGWSSANAPIAEEIKMQKQKISFELNKELDKSLVDDIIFILKDAGAENIEIDFDKGSIKEK